METIVCPYCDCKVKMNDVDDEGGACPECGAMITGTLLFEKGNCDVDEDVEDIEEEDDDDLDIDDDDD